MLEEYKEVLNASDSKERIEELADMLEIIQYLVAIEGKFLQNVLEVAKCKKIKRGGFDDKMFLERVLNSK